jgi:hypothetical protein
MTQPKKITSKEKVAKQAEPFTAVNIKYARNVLLKMKSLF